MLLLLSYCFRKSGFIHLQSFSARCLFIGENTSGSRFFHLSNGTGMTEPPLFECLRDIIVGLERIFLKLHENKMKTMVFGV